MLELFAARVGEVNIMCRITSVFCFVFRWMRTIVLEATGAQCGKLVLPRPNLFKHFFWFYIFAERLKPNWITNVKKSMARVLSLLYILKFGQEYLLYSSKAALWKWTKQVIFGTEPKA